MTYSQLTDEDLINRLDRLVSNERRCRLDVITHLAEFDSRGLYAKQGYPSLYAYCIGRFGYTEAEAYKRIQVARAIKRFPWILRMLRKDKICLTAVVMLAPHLTKENHTRLLGRAAGLSVRELEIFIAALAPRPDAKDCIRRLPSTLGLSCDVPQRIEPLSEDRVLFRFTGSQELRAKMERARSLLKAKYPHGDMEYILQEALDILLEKLDPAVRHGRRLKRQARSREILPSATEVQNPSMNVQSAQPSDVIGTACPSVGHRTARKIPQPVWDEVWVRDGGRCTFIGPDGRRCPERDALECDHIQPWAMGGRSDDPHNLRLMCRTHNQLLAREIFGTAFMEKRTKEHMDIRNKEPPA